MKRFFIAMLLVIGTGVGAVYAQGTVAKSSITFEIKNMGINTGGSLGGLTAKIHFVGANLSASTLEASVDVGTINTDNTTKDEHLRSEDFFDVAKYPKITMKSVALKHKSGDNYIGTFLLTIKDKTKQLDIPFSYMDQGNTVEFKSTFKINRLDFGVGSSSMILSDVVTVHLDCEERKTESATL